MLSIQSQTFDTNNGNKWIFTIMSFGIVWLENTHLVRVR